MEKKEKRIRGLLKETEREDENIICNAILGLGNSKKIIPKYMGGDVIKRLIELTKNSDLNVRYSAT